MAPLFRNTLRNMMQSMPLSERSRMAVRNYWRKVTRLSLCCGNPGQPGC